MKKYILFILNVLLLINGLCYKYDDYSAMNYKGSKSNVSAYVSTVDGIM